MSGPPYPPLPGPGSNAIGSFAIGVSPIGTIPAFDFWTTVISQYANSPTLTAMIQSFNDAVDATDQLDSFYDMVWNILTAQGEGLDVWGRILGVSRSVSLPSTAPPAFGFQEPADPTHFVGFGQAPFFTGAALTANFSFPDAEYRNILLAKAATNIWDGGMPTFNAILLGLFPNRGVAYVADNQNMTGTLTFGFPLTTAEQQLLGVPGFLPRPAGVSFSIASLPSWLPSVGVPPAMFADLTTEGTTNHYWFDGNTYGSFSAWLTAVGGTFSRPGGPASFTNSAGNLASASANVPRFDYDPVALVQKGLLLEAALTNNFVQSNAFTTSPWTDSGGTWASGQPGVDGTTSAWRFTQDNTNTTHGALQSVTLTAGQTYTISAYAKAGTGANGSFIGFYDSTDTGDNAQFNLSTGTVVGTVGSGVIAFIAPGPNGFYRCSMTFTAGGSGAHAVNINIFNGNGVTGTVGYLGDNTSNIFVTDAQCEQLQFPSSYVSTTTVIVTKGADTLTLPWTSATATFLTVNNNLMAYGALSRIVANNANTGDTPLSAGSTAAPPQINQFPQPGSGGVAFYVPSGFLPNAKFAVAGDPTGASITANGLTPARGTLGPLFGTPPNGIVFFQGGGQQAAFGRLQQFAAWTVRLSDAALATLTG